MLHALILSLLVHAMSLLGLGTLLSARFDAPAAAIKVVLSGGANRSVASPGLKTPTATAPLTVPFPRSPGVPKKNAPSTHPLVAEPLVLAARDVLPTTYVRGDPAEAVPASSAATDAPSAPALPRDAVNADDLRQYRISLAVAARSFKRYPSVARERGLEGTAEIALIFSARMPEPELTLVRSSGHLALDLQAQEMMAQAARATGVPESLKGRDLRILLPVQFSLEGNQ